MAVISHVMWSRFMFWHHQNCGSKLFVVVINITCDLSHQHYSAVRPGWSIRVCPEANIKGTLLRRLNFSCAYRRLNEHDPHWTFCDWTCLWSYKDFRRGLSQALLQTLFTIAFPHFCMTSLIGFRNFSVLGTCHVWITLVNVYFLNLEIVHKII